MTVITHQFLILFNFYFIILILWYGETDVNKIIVRPTSVEIIISFEIKNV